VSSFATRATAACVFRETIFAAVHTRLELLNFQGVVKKILPFAEAEGVPARVYVAPDGWLVAASGSSVVKMWNVKRSEPLSVVPGRTFEEYVLCCVVLCSLPPPSSLPPTASIGAHIPVLCGALWCGVVWCGVVRCGVVWCGVVWWCVVVCGVVWV
jgi:hypothetical protein